MAQCDALLIVGSTFPYVEYYPKPGQARVVQIDRDPQRIGLRQPVGGRAGRRCPGRAEMLNAQLQKKQDRSFLEMAQAETRRWYEHDPRRRDQRPAADEPLGPRRSTWGATAAGCGASVADSGHHTGLVGAPHPDAAGPGFRRLRPAGLDGLCHPLCGGRRLRISRPADLRGHRRWRAGDAARRILHRRRHGPAAEAAGAAERHARPDQVGTAPVPRQPGFRRGGAGDRFRQGGRGDGRAGYTIERPEQAGPVLDEALAAPGPAIIQAIVDPNEPLLPAVVSDAYAEHLRQALAAGATGCGGDPRGPGAGTGAVDDGPAPGVTRALRRRAIRGMHGVAPPPGAARFLLGPAAPPARSPRPPCPPSSRPASSATTAACLPATTPSCRRTACSPACCPGCATPRSTTRRRR